MIRPALALAALLALGPASAENEHRHPGEVMTGATGEFYETWMRPDEPGLSCCNRRDCYATEARLRAGRWEARRREDGAWLAIPESKMERNRDSPDGRNHLCAPPPEGERHYENGVICFIAGSGA